MKLLCECGSYLCRTTIEIPDDQIEQLERERVRHVMIADGCSYGPEPSDRLVEQRDGYALYDG